MVVLILTFRWLRANGQYSLWYEDSSHAMFQKGKTRRRKKTRRSMLNRIRKFTHNGIIHVKAQIRKVSPWWNGLRLVLESNYFLLIFWFSAQVKRYQTATQSAGYHMGGLDNQDCRMFNFIPARFAHHKALLNSKLWLPWAHIIHVYERNDFRWTSLVASHVTGAATKWFSVIIPQLLSLGTRKLIGEVGAIWGSFGIRHTGNQDVAHAGLIDSRNREAWQG